MTTATKPNLKLIVGLGNPGPRYRETRHNAGFLVVDELARRWGASWRRGRNAEETSSSGIILIKPQTFMNLSGQAVQGYASRLRLPPSALLVVHDDLDLPFGRIRFKDGGGAGGQKGVADTATRLGPDFLRLKIGISRPPAGWATENWVLSKFREDERDALERIVRAGADAVEALLGEGLERTMNRFHVLELAASNPGPDEKLDKNQTR